MSSSTSPKSQPLPHPAPQSPSDVFQHYQVMRQPDGSLWELGRGAMGITYKAFDVNLRCHVALKVVNAQHLHSETAKARFVREARAAARLRHPNVASVYHLGMDADSFFYAMEFIDGETLESLVRRLGPLAPATALRLVLQVARALIASSRQRLVHRDIKPANLMVVRDEDEDGDEHAQLRVKVIDFGLARSLFSTSNASASPATNAAGGQDHSALSNVTLGGFVGTPLFASPEQLEEKDLDARSDFYSLGVTLWYLLAGQPPFTGTLAGIISQHLTREPPLENLPTTVPATVRTLLARLLEKDAANRPQTAVELRGDLEACLRTVLAARAAREGEHGADTVAEPDSIFAVEAADLPTSGRRSDGESGFATGTILGNRFRIVRYVGEGSGGRVLLARDLQADDAPVAVRVMPSDLIATPQEEENFRADFERCRQAPHPALLAAHAFVRHGTHYYFAQEWMSGFSLVDLLRNRGTLALEDVLRVLRPAALATDHAAAHGMSQRLDFAPHQVLIHFPGDRVNDGSETPLRPVPLGPLSGWPDWQVKLDPLSTARSASDLLTWAGDMTLLPETEKLPTRDTHSSIAGWTPETDRSLMALGRLVYEMLGGGVTGGGPLRYVNRPALSEEANAVLGRCVNGDDGFASAAEFYGTLARSAGFDPDTLRPFISAPPPLAVSQPPTEFSEPESPNALMVLPSAGSEPAPSSESGETLETVSPALAQTRVETRRLPRPITAATTQKPRTRTPARKLTDIPATVPAERDPKNVPEPDRFAPLAARAASRGRASESAETPADPISAYSAADEWDDMLLGEPSGGKGWLRVAIFVALLLFCAAGVFAWRQTHRPAAPAPNAVAAANSRSPTIAPTPAVRPNAKLAPSAAVAPTPAPVARPKGTPAIAALPSPTPRTTPPQVIGAASPQPRAAETERAPIVAAPLRSPSPAAPAPVPPVKTSPRSLAEEIASSPAGVPSRLASVPAPPPVVQNPAALEPVEGKVTTNPQGNSIADGKPVTRSLEVTPIAPPPVPAPETVSVPAPTPALVAMTALRDAPSAESPTAVASRPPSEPSEAMTEKERSDSAPARAVEKRVAVHLTSEPSKAEISLRGETLGVTPKTVMLPPGEHELVAHYWNWPEVRQQIYLSTEDKSADVKIRLISPDQIPINRDARKEKERGRDKKSDGSTGTRPAHIVPVAPPLPPPAAIPVTPEGVAPAPTPRRRGPFGLFGRAKPREAQPPVALPVLPAQPVSPPGRSGEGQPFFDGRSIIEQPLGGRQTDGFETEKPRGQ